MSGKNLVVASTSTIWDLFVQREFSNAIQVQGLLHKTVFFVIIPCPLLLS